MNNLKPQFLSITLFLVINSVLLSQNVDIPQTNQRAKISQRLGLTWITIEYSSPSLRDGDIAFGGRVPYGTMWAAGARENTTIEFEHNVLLEGKAIKAGKYGLFMKPDKDKFQIVLSKYSRSWSQTFPTDEETVLKVTVIPTEIPFKKWLSYDFIERGNQHLLAILEWGKVGVPFKIEINDPSKVVYESLMAEMKGRGQFIWGANYDAANNLNFMNVYLDQAMIWVDKSLELEPKGRSFGRRGLSLWLKARLLIKKEGYSDQVRELMDEAITLIDNPFDLNNAVINLIQNEDTKKAIEGGTRLVTEFSDHQFIWGFTDTLAEAYLKDGNTKKALKYYKLAKSTAPEIHHEYFDGVIAGIKE